MRLLVVVDGYNEYQLVLRPDFLYSYKPDIGPWREFFDRHGIDSRDDELHFRQLLKYIKGAW